jgi:hypothetical protein
MGRRPSPPRRSSRMWKGMSGVTRPGFQARRTVTPHAEDAETQGGGLVTTFREQQSERSRLRSWSRTRWLVLAAVLIAVVVAIVLILTYTGGSSGGGGGGGY